MANVVIITEEVLLQVTLRNCPNSKFMSVQYEKNMQHFVGL